MTFMVVDIDSYDILFGLDFLIKNWCNRGCGTKLNPNKTWSKGQCGGITIDYGKSTTKNKLRNFDAGCHCSFGELTY